ncbi:MAG TPA: hypothetical protein VF677_07930, partial [Flavobacterium sp.]
FQGFNGNPCLEGRIEFSSAFFHIFHLFKFKTFFQLIKWSDFVGVLYSICAKKRRMPLQSGLLKKFPFFKNTATVVCRYNLKKKART